MSISQKGTMLELGINLDKAHTRARLAMALNVPVPIADVMQLGAMLCQNTGCPCVEATNNKGQCILCSKVWYPTMFNSKGQLMKINHHRYSSTNNSSGKDDERPNSIV